MRRVGRYHLRRRLGAGGQGEVWEADLVGSAGHVRTVALKLVADGEGLRREARIGGLLRHPNLVDVYEVGEHDGTWFVAMEICAGGTLAERLPLSPRAVVDVGLQVCAALGYAHRELGLVHLDLKPSNLLLSGAAVKVGDLGIARARGFEGPLRGGTRGYRSPEHQAGQAVDGRADIYALGVVLVELATGVRGGDAETYDLDGDDAPTVEAVPGWLRAISERCTAPAPEDRYPSMEALAEALAALDVRGEPLVAGTERADEARTTPAAPPAPFVGRADELARVEAALVRGAACTLKGAGGMGKTRLAREVVARLRAAAYAASLADAQGRADVVQALEQAVGTVPAADEDAAIARVGRALAAARDPVLLIDDCERARASADLLDRLRDVAPALRVLATSRVALGLRGEIVLEVPPLGADDGLALLVERARLRGVEVRDGADARELVARLDGVPLALELAAGRLGVLSVGDVVGHLDLSLLRTASEDVPERQRSLEATLRWSWDLLPGWGRAALAQLSVFAGPFDAAAAEGLLDLTAHPDAPWTLDVLEALVDGSWLGPRDGGRYGAHLAVQEFAARHLDPAEAEATRRRHAALFAARWDAGALAASQRTAGTARRERLVRDLPELVAATRWARGAGEAALATPTGLAALDVLRLAGPVDRGVAVADDVLAVCDPAWRSKVLRMRSTVLQLGGRTDEAVASARESVAAAERWSDRATVLSARLALAGAMGDAGRHEEALAAMDALFPELASANPSTEVTARMNRASLAYALGRHEEAVEGLTAAVARAREVDQPRIVAHALGNLAAIRAAGGDRAAARAAYAEAAELHRRNGDRRGELVSVLNLALALVHLGEPAEARRLAEQARARGVEIGDPRIEGFALVALAAVARVADPEGALALLDRARPLLSSSGDHRQAAAAEMARAGIFHELGRRDDALRASSDAVATARSVGDPNVVVEALAVSARIRWECGLADEARRVLGEADLLPPPRNHDARKVLAEAVALVRG